MTKIITWPRNLEHERLFERHNVIFHVKSTVGLGCLPRVVAMRQISRKTDPEPENLKVLIFMSSMEVGSCAQGLPSTSPYVPC